MTDQLTRIADLPRTGSGCAAALVLEPRHIPAPVPKITSPAQARKTSMQRAVNRALDKLETYLQPRTRDVDMIDVAEGITGMVPSGVIVDELHELWPEVTEPKKLPMLLPEPMPFHAVCPGRDPASIPAAGWPPKKGSKP